MKRAISTLTAALLLMACEGDKGPSGADTQGVSPTAPTDGEDTTGEGATVTGAPETGGPSVTTGATDTAGDPDTDTGDDPTCTFVCDTTGDGTTISECDNWTQDCIDGEKCSAYANDGGSSWNALKCVSVQQNPGQPGDPCTVEGNGVSGVDSCDLGGMCWNVDADTGQGTCVALCTGSPKAANCGVPETSCVIANEGVLNLCLGTCDPLLQDCEGSDLCLPNPNDPDGFVCVLDASGPGGAVFDPCEFANACDKGLVCQDPGFATECDPGANGCCLPYCKISDPECPGAGQDCIAWYDEGTAPPGYMDLGLCGIPMG